MGHLLQIESVKHTINVASFSSLFTSSGPKGSKRSITSNHFQIGNYCNKLIFSEILYSISRSCNLLKIFIQEQPPEQYYKKRLAKLTGKHLCQSLFVNKVAGTGTKHLWNKTLLFIKCFWACWRWLVLKSDFLIKQCEF